MVLIKSSYYLIFGLLVSAAIFTKHTQAKENGAPPQACKDMRPSHDNTGPQESHAPYEIVLAKEIISSNENIGVTLRVKSHVNESNPASEGFKGYLLMAYDANGVNLEPLGTFQEPTEQSDGKALDCDFIWNGERKSFPKAAVTHTNKGKKRTVEAIWTPPSGYTGPIIFKATFVQERNTFWIQETSKHVEVVHSQVTSTTETQMSTLVPAASTTSITVTSTTTSSTTKPNSATSLVYFDEVYTTISAIILGILVRMYL